MSPLASWCLLGALIAVVFTVLWLLSGEQHDGDPVDDDLGYLEDDDATYPTRRDV